MYKYSFEESAISQDHPILILGTDVVVKSFVTTLNFWHNNSYHLDQILTNPINLPTIFSVTTPSKAIGQIHHLRSKLQWEGTFIAILCTTRERKELQNLSLFGHLNGELAYSDIPGHLAFTSTSPHLLSDILTLNLPLNRLRTSAWQGYLSKSALYPLLQQLHHLNPPPNLIPQILTTLHSLNIDWDSLISHENARYIRHLKAQYPPGTMPPSAAHSQIFTHLKQTLANITP
jgi:hypothetical protein